MSVTLQETVQSVLLKNDTSREQQLWFEPLGDGLALRPDVLYELTATNRFGKLEIDMRDDGFTVYGWVVKVVAIENDSRSDVWEIP